MKIYQSIAKIKRFRKPGFTRITKGLFFYNRSAELDRKYNTIVAWVLIYNKIHKIVTKAILEISFYRLHARSVPQWTKMWTNKTRALSKHERKHLYTYGRTKHLTLLEILNDHILASLNARHNADWRIESVIGWSHGISRYRRTEISRRYKTTKRKKK